MHLEEQLAGYDKVNKEVGIWKASAANMLKRFRSFLGKDEAEHSASENVDLECANITKRLGELMEKLELQKFQVFCYYISLLYSLTNCLLTSCNTIHT